MVQGLRWRSAIRCWAKKSRTKPGRGLSLALLMVCSLAGPVLGGGEALLAQLHQLGHGAQVPIGVGQVPVSQIGGQGPELGADRFPAPIPGQERADGKSVAQIVQAGDWSVGPTQAATELGESRVHTEITQWLSP